VATYSTGVTASFRGIAFTEITSVSVNYGGSTTGRSGAWTADYGSVSIECLGASGVTTSLFGFRGAVSVSGGGMALTHSAIYEGFSMSPELNGVTRYTVNLKLVG
jgi:hypothetical protein